MKKKKIHAFFWRHTIFYNFNYIILEILNKLYFFDYYFGLIKIIKSKKH